MADHAEKQTERMEQRRKLPAGGAFLPGEAMYDEHGNLLPTGTRPAPNPRSRPEEGAVTAHPAEQYAPAPEAPETPNPWGGTTSVSLGDTPGDTAAAQRIHEKEENAPSYQNRE